MEMFKRLKATPRSTSKSEGAQVLMLDTSGSMTADDGKGRRIDLLREAVNMIEGLKDLTVITFANAASILEPGRAIPEPWGSTSMHNAFNLARANRKTTAVLITDGEPDSEKLAFEAAHGFSLDIVYVGPEPMPAFLINLAHRCGGTVQIGKLADPKLLAHKLTGLLEHKDDVIHG